MTESIAQNGIKLVLRRILWRKNLENILTGRLCRIETTQDVLDRILLIIGGMALDDIALQQLDYAGGRNRETNWRSTRWNRTLNAWCNAPSAHYNGHSKPSSRM
jgi:hypothetical protein